MNATKSRAAAPQLTVAEYIGNMIFSMRLSQREIAQHLGYKNANVITMIHQGRTKLPINKVALMAEALKVDKRFLLNLAMSEYMPEAWEAIKDCLGEDLSLNANDVALVNAMKPALAGHPVEVGDKEVQKILDSACDKILARQAQLAEARKKNWDALPPNQRSA